MQVQPKAFRYEVKGVEESPFSVIVLVSSGTIAKMALNQSYPKEKYPNASFMLQSVTDRIMQVNEGVSVIEGETKIVPDSEVSVESDSGTESVVE